ncbi:hypothetical protein B0H19DRAFT_1067663 [Mycena capillaripes]|nr:hypothetical protein B0H19DRAFT_1067663 [Mycena capillaripes]
MCGRPPGYAAFAQHLGELARNGNLGGVVRWDRKPWLNKLSNLEELVLRLPRWYEPLGLNLRSTHPCLKRFKLTSCLLLPGLHLDFLVRDPTLNYPYLETEHPMLFSLPSQLRALNVAHNTFLRSPTFRAASQPQLTQRLRNMRQLSVLMVSEAVTAIVSTLRCLELDEVEEYAYAGLLKYVGPFLHPAPSLEELGFLGCLLYPMPAIPRSTILAVPLMALRFLDHYKTKDPLSCSLLEDLGLLPARLKYIEWDVTSQPVVYIRQVAQKPHEPHAAFVHCAKPYGMGEMSVGKCQASWAAIGSRRACWSVCVKHRPMWIWLLEELRSCWSVGYMPCPAGGAADR